MPEHPPRALTRNRPRPPCGQRHRRAFPGRPPRSEPAPRHSHGPAVTAPRSEPGHAHSSAPPAPLPVARPQPRSRHRPEPGHGHPHGHPHGPRSRTQAPARAGGVSAPGLPGAPSDRPRTRHPSGDTTHTTGRTARIPDTTGSPTTRPTPQRLRAGRTPHHGSGREAPPHSTSSGHDEGPAPPGTGPVSVVRPLAGPSVRRDRTESP